MLLWKDLFSQRIFIAYNKSKRIILPGAVLVFRGHRGAARAGADALLERLDGDVGAGAFFVLSVLHGKQRPVGIGQ